MDQFPRWQATQFGDESVADPNRKEHLRSQRLSLFVQCEMMIRRMGVVSGSVLDFGCEYGHMLDYFSGMGWKCAGIEIAPRLRMRLNHEGRYRICNDIGELSRDECFDAITLIDSLYYHPRPAVCLRQLTGHLAPGGVILVRIANRAPAMRAASGLLAANWLGRLMGDQVVAISHRGIRVMAERLGLRILAAQQREARRFPRRQFPSWLAYRLLPLLAAVTGIRLSPGIIYVLGRQANNRSST